MSGLQNNPTFAGIPYSAISLVTLTVQNSVLTILLHYSQTAKGVKPYSAASAVLLSELIKGSVSLVLAIKKAKESPAPSAQGNYSPVSQYDSRRPSIGNPAGGHSWISAALQVYNQIFTRDAWKLAVPATCYVLQNNLGFFAAQNLDVATFQVSYQMKILTTAFFSVIMLNRKLSVLKWASLVGLAVGVATVQLQGVDTSREGHGGANPFLGFLAVTIGCTTSGFAGVYFEKVLKGSTVDVWTRNVQLSLWSLPPAFFPAAFPNFSFREGFSQDYVVVPDGPTWIFGNFWGWPLATVVFQAVGGIITALVIKYSDNIAKGFATSLSIILSFLAGVLLFGAPVTISFLVGASIVLVATYAYNQPDGPRPPVIPSSSSGTPIGVYATGDAAAAAAGGGAGPAHKAYLYDDTHQRGPSIPLMDSGAVNQHFLASSSPARRASRADGAVTPVSQATASFSKMSGV